MTEDEARKLRRALIYAASWLLESTGEIVVDRFGPDGVRAHSDTCGRSRVRRFMTAAVDAIAPFLWDGVTGWTIEIAAVDAQVNMAVDRTWPRGRLANRSFLNITKGKGKTMDFSFQLGDRVRDTITGFEGVIVARSQWLHACNTYAVQASELKDGKPIDRQHFDEPQLTILEPGAVEPSDRTNGGPERPDIRTR